MHDVSRLCWAPRAVIIRKGHRSSDEGLERYIRDVVFLDEFQARLNPWISHLLVVKTYQMNEFDLLG